LLGTCWRRTSEGQAALVLLEFLGVCSKPARTEAIALIREIASSIVPGLTEIPNLSTSPRNRRGRPQAGGAVHPSHQRCSNKPAQRQRPGCAIAEGRVARRPSLAPKVHQQISPVATPWVCNSNALGVQMQRPGSPKKKPWVRGGMQAAPCIALISQSRRRGDHGDVGNEFNNVPTFISVLLLIRTRRNATPVPAPRGMLRAAVAEHASADDAPLPPRPTSRRSLISLWHDHSLTDARRSPAAGLINASPA
jgi:hypothetical protein